MRENAEQKTIKIIKSIKTTKTCIFISCMRISFPCILENTKHKKIKYAKNQQQHASLLCCFWFYVFLKNRKHKKYKTHEKSQKYACSFSKNAKTYKNLYNPKTQLWMNKQQCQEDAKRQHLKQYSLEQRHLLACGHSEKPRADRGSRWARNSESEVNPIKRVHQTMERTEAEQSIARGCLYTLQRLKVYAD